MSNPGFALGVGWGLGGRGRWGVGVGDSTYSGECWGQCAADAGWTRIYFSLSVFNADSLTEFMPPPPHHHHIPHNSVQSQTSKFMRPLEFSTGSFGNRTVAQTHVNKVHALGQPGKDGTQLLK